MTTYPQRTVLLHPAALVSLGLLVLNDHALKPAYGNWLTGKLSDVAGLVVFPLLVVSIADHITHARHRPPPALPPLLGSAIVLTGVFFAGVQLSNAIAGFYIDVVTVLWRPITVTQDPTDLFALPSLAGAWWVGQRADRSRRFLVAASVSRPPTARSQRRRRARAARGSGRATSASSTG